MPFDLYRLSFATRYNISYNDKGECALKRETGLFVSFEGIDGCGKSTQIALLKETLEQQGESVLIVREPGGTALGERIRDILLDRKSIGMHAETELLLFEAARAQIVRDVIKPALLSGMIVLCDRFFDSTIAYQGYARGLDIEAIQLINRFAAGGLEPNLTFLLDLPVETAWERQAGRGVPDRLEAEGLSFMQNVKDGYLKLAQTLTRMVVLDAKLSVSVLAQEIADRFREVT